MTLAIRTESLTKHYGEVKALIDLSLEVRMGEVFGFLGPTEGLAEILGMDTHEEAVEIRNHIGYVPGDLAMYPNLTGRDTLTYFANLRGGVDWSYVDELAERLSVDLDVKVGNYSSGNRQKVGIIQAFMNRPQVLVMDEPSTGLDPLVQREFQKMMREVAADGRCVFLSSHTLSEVQRVADRVGIIRHGRLVDVESVHDLRSKAIRRVELFFDTDIDASIFEAVAGVREAKANQTSIVLSFDGHMDQLLKTATDHYHLVDITSQEADLEEIFLTYYRDED